MLLVWLDINTIMNEKIRDYGGKFKIFSRLPVLYQGLEQEIKDQDVFVCYNNGVTTMIFLVEEEMLRS